MRKNGFYYLACLFVPHIMLIVGLIYLSKADVAKKTLGKKVCVLSTGVLIAGSLIYYLFFTPIFGLD